jgi:MATE family multidrug resistance protein
MTSPARHPIRAEMPGILRLAVPIVAGLSASTLIGVTDSLMLAPLGPVALAAAGLAGAAALIIYAALYGLLSALSVRIGQAWGAGEARRIPLILRNGLALGALAGLAGALLMGAGFFLLLWLGQPPEVIAAVPGYWAAISLFMIPFSLLTVFKASFEAIDRPWLGTAFAFVAVVVNVPLNYALIWGLGPLPELGLLGAGIASVAAESFALALAWAFWRGAPSMRRLRLRRALTLSEIGASLREGAPLGALYVAETGAMAVAVALVGAFGTVALAANQVASSIGALLYMLPLGVAGAVAIRVAQEQGAGNRAALRPIAWAALAVVTLWQVAGAAALILGAGAIAGLVTNDPAVIAAAAAILLVFAPMQIADGIQSTALGALRGMSDVALPAAVSILAYWVIALPLGWVAATRGGLGPPGIWAGFLAGLILAAAILLRRFLVRTAADLPSPP